MVMQRQAVAKGGCWRGHSLSLSQWLDWLGPGLGSQSGCGLWRPGRLRGLEVTLQGRGSHEKFKMKKWHRLGSIKLIPLGIHRVGGVLEARAALEVVGLAGVRSARLCHEREDMLA